MVHQFIQLWKGPLHPQDCGSEFFKIGIAYLQSAIAESKNNVAKRSLRKQCYGKALAETLLWKSTCRKVELRRAAAIDVTEDNAVYNSVKGITKL